MQPGSGFDACLPSRSNNSARIPHRLIWNMYNRDMRMLCNNGIKINWSAWTFRSQISRFSQNVNTGFLSSLSHCLFTQNRRFRWLCWWSIIVFNNEVGGDGGGGNGILDTQNSSNGPNWVYDYRYNEIWSNKSINWGTNYKLWQNIHFFEELRPKINFPSGIQNTCGLPNVTVTKWSWSCSTINTYHRSVMYSSAIAHHALDSARQSDSIWHEFVETDEVLGDITWQEVWTE